VVLLGSNRILMLTGDDAVGPVFVKLGGGRGWRHHHGVILRSSCRSRCCAAAACLLRSCTILLVHVFVGHLVGRIRKGRIRRRRCRWCCRIKQGDWIPPPPQESWKAAVVVVSTIGAGGSSFLDGRCMALSSSRETVHLGHADGVCIQGALQDCLIDLMRVD